MSEQIIIDAQADIEEGALSEEHARQLVDHAREKLRSAGDHLSEAHADLEDAKVIWHTARKGRAWVSLGYGSWKDLCDAEFSAVRIWQSKAERDERIRTFREEGWSVRTIGDLMNVSVGTVHAASVASVQNRTVANSPTETPASGTPATDRKSGTQPPATRAPASLGLDGRERPQSRATSEQRVERAVRAYQLHSEGMKTPEIGRELGVSQRQAWSDVNDMGSWTERLSAADRERLSAGQMKGREFAQKADLEVASEGPKLRSSAEAGRRALRDAVNFLHTNVIMADAWLQEGKDLSPGMAETTTATTLQISHWLAEDLEWTDLDAEECTRALGDLQQAMQYLEQATSELTGLVTQ